MRKIVTATQILATIFVGLIIGGAIADNSVAWITGLCLLIIDVLIGITTKYLMEKDSGNKERKSASNSYFSTGSPKTITTQPITFIPKGRYKLSEFIKEDALTSRLMDTVVSVDESKTSRYDKRTNIIHISAKDNLTENSFLNVLSRCYQQAYCYDLDILYSSTPIGMSDPDAETIDEYLMDDWSYKVDDILEHNITDDVAEQDIEEESEEEPIINMLGEEVNEKTFAENQKVVSGFFPDYSFNKDKYTALKIKKQEFDDLNAFEESKLIFPLIFGNFDCKIDLNKALLETNKLLNRILEKKPTKNLVRSNKDYMSWLTDYAIPQILLGTIYAYQQEYVKSAYHFMLGLKTEQIPINMPYCDFIRYILGKLSRHVRDNAILDGCGYSVENPMGSCGGSTLIAQNAMQIIPEMEGDNGEVIVARLGKTGMFGYLERLGSKLKEDSFEMIDVYETYVIDSDYNIKKLQLYFNGYFDLHNETVRIADGFKLKSHSILFDSFKIVES